MRFPNHWYRATANKLVAWGWSEHSEAKRNAVARLEKIQRWLSSDQDEELARYHYEVDDVIREFVIEQIVGTKNEILGVVSRNAYGSLILNAASMLIVDIDIEHHVTRPSLLGRLLGKHGVDADSIRQHRLELIRSLSRQNPNWSLGVYQTAAGLRVIVTNEFFPAQDAFVASIMDMLMADRLYRKLCRTQNCFRARLTPKPWRIGLTETAPKFPFPNSDVESEFDRWYKKYLQRAAKYSVCQKIAHFGPDETIPECRPLVELHDRLTLSNSTLPLA